MTIGLLTNIVSPHQLPLAQAISDLIGPENYRYVHTEEFHAERAKMGWGSDVSDLKFRVDKLNEESRTWLEHADLVYCEERDLDLFKKRIELGRTTIYVSERWFRPPFGWLRLLHPRFLSMAIRMVACLRKPGFYYFPQGVHAWRDMKILCRLFGFWKCEPKFRMWGYFVAPSKFTSDKHTEESNGTLKVLWVGRMLKLKRVDTLIQAVAHANRRTSLTLIGDGKEESNLKRLSESICDSKMVTFLPSVPIDEVRHLMQQHDLYVFPSDGGEGWGAVVSEALEEGMMVLGSYEAGASATMLPDTHLFHAGDWRRLAALLQQVADGKLPRIPIGDWTAAKAAERMVGMV